MFMQGVGVSPWFEQRVTFLNFKKGIIFLQALKWEFMDRKNRLL